eukprot:CAMPEP_0174373174 /NCGR_PEP_ID=MMETSP0811_2-20130205/106102_1 /TAXON_ID=73025 ORGANISM="Eutreptiella gymnastica-like, Strain CCMP1594" /NCGR_SAMPLE_ID=MMETSP0811_2 /ASSEMBLY_ACC=CAM_ASM_000667 /LENGTH=133 /DNA_ID=CAMNT_0015521225 /DNA_START=141 /DNA_END=543 /DNA_ORIENTATION=+
MRGKTSTPSSCATCYIVHWHTPVLLSVTSCCLNKSPRARTAYRRGREHVKPAPEAKMMPSRITQHTGGGQNLTQMKAVLEVRGLAAVHMMKEVTAAVDVGVARACATTNPIIPEQTPLHPPLEESKQLPLGSN